MINDRDLIPKWADLSKSLLAQSNLVRDALGPVLSNTAFVPSTRLIADQLASWERIAIPKMPPVQMIPFTSALSSLQLSAAFAASLERTANLYGSNLGQLEAVARNLQASFAPLVGPSLATGRLAVALESFGSEASKSLSRGTAELSDLAKGIYERFTKVPSLSDGLPRWLLQAPTLEPYLATRALGIVEQAPMELLDSERDAEAESILETLGDGLEGRLATVGAEFVGPYVGALQALQTRQADWPRHVSVSVRELMDKLLARLAPDGQLRNHFPQLTREQWNKGAFTHRARLQFIFRKVAIDEFTRMAEVDIDVTLATFFPANAGVHTLVAPLNEAQMMVLWRRIQGCISTVLQAAGH